ncbi:glycosyltransferase family 4 protein [Fibrella sp. HMF5335]|uniref:Glycosyltransferase family 4 protein n=1 Tax=Fibrella rubiginis TaxID=2817060 RepID=A0A939K6U9_9BACT|nr:glycosyltransferase family 1 protein [Fibrella rubiginis]MBO0937945.1 glycosyltransferase family 4 protein [Fibrella rubiginis]
MKILYYIADLTQSNGGIRQYACALLKLLAQERNNEYYVLTQTNDPIITSIIQDNANVILIPNNLARERSYEKLMRQFIGISALLSDKYTKFKNSTMFSRTQRLCNKYNIDIVYCPYQYIPNTDRKTVSTLHDVQELHFPGFFTPHDRLHRAAIHKTITERATLIVVSYDHIKDDLINYFYRTEENVLTCLLDMKNLWFDEIKPDQIIDLSSYNLPDSFIFYPAAMWPHKNHIGLIKAIAYLRTIYSLKINIVFTGHKHNHYEVIKNEVHNLRIEDQVYFLGIVDELTLFSLYHAAQAVVVPTLYEAGSFPLMESIIMGVPVIASNVTSLPTAMGDSRFLFDPTNTVDMAEMIKRICTDTAFIDANLLNSQKQAVNLRDSGALKKISQALTQI